MAPSRQPDDSQVQAELALYSTLCVLEAQYGEGAKQVDLQKNMFRKQNLKAFEYILQHAYSVVKGKAAAKKHLRWPYADKDPKQRKEFYANVTAWLRESTGLEGYGNSLEAFRRNPQGPKLVNFLLDLVTYALSVQQERMFPDDTVVQDSLMEDQLLMQLREPLLTSAKAQNQQQVQRLLRALKTGSDVQQQAQHSAAHISDVYYSLRAQLAQTQALGDHAATTAGSEQSSHKPVQGDACGASHQWLQLPGDLLEEYADLEGLWGQLEQHALLYKDLSQTVDGLSCSDIHPHAIDAVRLRQHGKLPPAPNAAGLDIAAMMEAWLVDVGAVCRYIKYLAGLSEGEPPHSAVSKSSAVSPLLATSEASSHAPHLYAQLGLHRSCLEHLRAIRTAMQTQLTNTAERILKLEEKLYSLIASEKQACLAAMESVPLLPGAEDEFQFVPFQQQPAAALPYGPSMSLLSGSNLPLVPPTPLLQQLVHKSKTASQPPVCDLHSTGHQMEASKSSAACHPHITAVSDKPSSSRTVCSEEASRTVHAEPVSSASSVSSTALPAPELLLSRQHADELMDPDIMDLDLVDSDDDIYKPSSPVLSLQSAGANRFDPLRLSMPQTSPMFQSDGPAALQKPMLEASAPAERQDRGTADGLHDLDVQAVDCSSWGETHVAEHRSNSKALLCCSSQRPDEVTAAAASTSDAGEVAAGHQMVQFADTAEDAKNTPDAAASTAASPAHGARQPIVPHSRGAITSSDSGLLAFQPMTLASAPGSDCFSSARPRRLTFAAAVHGDDCGNVPVCNQSSNLFSPSSSDFSSGSPDTGATSAAPSQLAPGNQTDLSLSLLRQRFAATQQ